MSENKSSISVEIDENIQHKVTEMGENEAGMSTEINMDSIETETIEMTANEASTCEKIYTELEAPETIENESCKDVDNSAEKDKDKPKIYVKISTFEILTAINCLCTILVMGIVGDCYYLQVHADFMDDHIKISFFVCMTLSVLIFILFILFCTKILKKKDVYVIVFFLFGISNVICCMVLTYYFGEVWTFYQIVIFVTIIIIMIISDQLLGRRSDKISPITDTEVTEANPPLHVTSSCVTSSGHGVNEQPDDTENPTQS